MARIEKGYKICRMSNDGRWLSGLVSGNPCSFPQVAVEYALGAKSRRNACNGPLGVFIDLKSVEQFMVYERWDAGVKYAVFKCNYCRSKFNAFWFLKTGKVKETRASHIPSGTAFAASVTLTEKLCEFRSYDCFNKYDFDLMHFVKLQNCQTGYKICMKDQDGNWASCKVASSPLDKSRARYNFDNFTNRVPGNGPYGVFSSYNYAVDFISRELWKKDAVYALFECKYEKSVDKSFWISFTENDKTNKVNSWYAPDGTVFADSVILTKKVANIRRGSGILAIVEKI